MKKTDKRKLTRVQNTFNRWNEKYLSNPSPYIIDKYTKALKKYNSIVAELKRKYTGEQIELL